MLIKTHNTDTTAICHDETTYKVVEGYADVPMDVVLHMTAFPDWEVVNEPVDEKVLAELQGDEPAPKKQRKAASNKDEE